MTQLNKIKNRLVKFLDGFLERNKLFMFWVGVIIIVYEKPILFDILMIFSSFYFFVVSLIFVLVLLFICLLVILTMGGKLFEKKNN